MGFERKKKKGAAEFGSPNYDSKSNYLTVVMHCGGAFSNSPSTVYKGGKQIIFDWCKASEIGISSLNSFAERAGITGIKRYQLRMKDESFKLLIDDEDVKKWCNEFLTTREVHIYSEVFEDDSDSDDLDFKCGSVCYDSDDSEFDKVVDFDVEYEYDSISTDNVYVEGQLPNVEGAANVEGADVDDEETEMESFEDSDFTSGDSASEAADAVDDEMFEEEVDRFADEFDTIDANNIIDDDGQPNNAVVDDEDTDSDSGDESDVVEAKDFFEDGRVSQDDEDADQYPFFNPKTKFNPEFVLKQVFTTKKVFKTAVESQAIKLRRNIKFTKNDKNRMYARCQHPDCKWMIHALRMKDDTAFQIRKIIDKHSCAPSNKIKSMTSTWLSERFLQRFKSDSGRSLKGFMVDAMHDTRCEISKTQAYKAKKKALEKLEGDPDAQYSKLWAYADELRNTNPGSTITLGTEVNNGVTMFSSFYVCFNAPKQGFMRGCRKLLGVDGCFLKGKHGGMLLTAVGVDGNNNPFPVAYAVVEKENQDIWEWFLHLLKQDLEIKVDEFTFMSDKQKGLIGAMEAIFPGVDHRFCVRHLINNMKVAGFRGVDYQQALWKAAYSTTEGQWNVALNELKAVGEGAWEWIQNKPPHQWSKAFFQEKSKCDLLLNNICESFNANILEARDKPIITMLEWIRESLMVRLQRNRDRALKKWKGKICPKIQKIMNRNSEKVNDCISLKSSDTHYQISCFDGAQYTVDLRAQVCSCRSWQLTGIPCTHSISAMLRQKLDPMDFVSDFYYVDTYNSTYADPIFGISYDVLWGESMFIPPLPPNFGQRAKRGRKPHKRRVGPFEASERKNKGKLQKMKRQCNPYKCKKCGQLGHNSLSCGKEKRKYVKKARTDSGNTGTSRSAECSSPQPAGHLAPPLPRRVEDCHIEVEDGGTQHSQITSDTAQRPKVAGPSIHQQIQMGRAKK